MKRCLWLAAVALGCASATAQAPMIRAHLEPAGKIIVGEPVRLVVTVLVPNYFTGSPDFPEFELENAIVVLPQETPQNSSEQVRGVTYSGITEVYTLYPQQPGDFSLPPAEIDVPYASTPPKTTLAHLALPSLTFHADLPEEAKGLDYFLPTTELTLQEHWSPALQKLRAGDTVERTVTVTAVKMQAMLIPPLSFEAPDGIRVYQEEPAVQDVKSSRNEFLFGRRTQQAKYFIQKQGSYTLPPIELKWWNLSTRRLMTAVLPAVRFEAAANPEAVAELPPEQPPVAAVQQPQVSFWERYRRRLYIASACLLAALLLLWLAYRWLPAVFRSIKLQRQRRRESEPAYFRALLKACKGNHPMEAYAALLRWLNRWSPGKPLDDAIARSHDTELAIEIDRLGAALFSSSATNGLWNGRRLAKCLEKLRQQKTSSSTRKSALVKLNP